MKIMRHRGTRFRRTTAAGLALLLFPATLPGCVARNDWSKVQAVTPNTPTHVQLHHDEPIKGRLLSATGDSVTLRFKNGRTDTYPRKDLLRVLTHWPLAERWPGWIALAVPNLTVQIIASANRMDVDGTTGFHLLLLLPALPFFLLSNMRTVYEAPSAEQEEWYPRDPPEKNSRESHPRDPQGPSSSDAGTGQPEDSR